MYKPVIFWSMECDRCGTVFSNYDDYTCFPDTDMIDYADDWAEVGGDRHYCPNCHTYNEETEEVTVKPPYPFELLRLKKILNSGLIASKYPEFELSEDEEFYMLSNSYSLAEFPESARLYVKEMLGEDARIISEPTGRKVPGLVGGSYHDGYKFTILTEKKNYEKK